MKMMPSAIEAAVCRWTARIVGTLLVVLCVILAISEGMPNPLTQLLKIQIGFLALALILAGILAGWRLELSGGIISLFGWGLFFVAVIQSFKSLTGFVMALALPGALYVASALLRLYHEKHPSA